MAELASQIATHPAPTAESLPPNQTKSAAGANAHGNGASATSAATVKQSAAPKPVLKMKRTGRASLPETAILTRNGSFSPSPMTDSPTPATLSGLDSEPEPATITSDILPPPATPTLDVSTEGPKRNAASDGPRRKYATDEARRKATSLALQKRWASGAMDHVHQKRLETIRLRKEAEGLLGTPGITKKISTLAGSIAPTYTTQTAVNNAPGLSPNLRGLTSTPATTRHAQKRSLVSEQLARLFDSRPASASAVSAGPGSGQAYNSINEEQESIYAPSSASSDVELPNSKPIHRYVRPDQADSESILAFKLKDGAGDQSDWEEDSLSKDGSGGGKVSGDIPQSIELAAPGRPYTKWRDADGTLSSAYGALFPEHYELSTTTPQHPWICPIRSCRKVFEKLRQLGHHFNIKHRGILLHDNDDGTFSERGKYAPRIRDGYRLTGVKKPAIVISRGPADHSDPPPRSPSYPGTKDGTPNISASVTPKVEDDGLVTTVAKSASRTRSARFSHDVSVDYSPGAEMEIDDVLEGNEADASAIGHTNTGYMDESAGGETLPPGGVPTAITEAEPGRPYTMWPDENGQLVSLSGALLPAGYQLDTTIPGRPWVCPVRTCRKAFGKRSDLGFHFERVHFAAHLNDNGDGTFSVKGVYQSRQTCIGKGGKILVKAPPIVVSKETLGQNNLGPLPKAQLPPYLCGMGYKGHGEEEDSVHPQKVAASSESADLWAAHPRRDGLRTRQSSKRAEAEVEAADAPTIAGARSQQVKAQAPPSSRPRQPPHSSLISQGVFQAPADFLEMEDWEVAPGRIREASTADAETIAFSKAYLSANQAVPVCDDVVFRVDTIASGKTLRLQADENKMRVCTVAAGKVRVKVGDEPEFTIGPHGVFKVKAGMACSIRNRMYIGAVLHIMVLPGY
ncbi:hypothetical protein VTK56DRAFT_1140 [Thermocarpiscus australiensis]